MLSKEIIELVNAAAVEIVVLKPEESASITYEKELPWENIPFHIRNDKYFSIGTAFAISESELVTAAHVLNLGEKSKIFNKFFIRDSQGQVFEINTILKADNRWDLVHFTAKGKTFDRYFTMLKEYTVNQSVFTVGSALGEGIVIRDGLLLGTIPEQSDGEWLLLKSSAGANPGNSGGPLLDSQGRVLAIVQGLKDNIVYSLPIKEFIDAKAGVAVFSTKYKYGLSNITQTLKKEYYNEVRCPKPYQEVTNEEYKHYLKFYNDSMTELIESNKKTIFPAGKQSKPLLERVITTYYPEIIFENKDDGSWNLSKTDTQTYRLDNEGMIIAGTVGDFATADINKPKDMTLAEMYRNPKVFMDYFLKAINISRPIGGEKIRITSFGEPFYKERFIDSYKRKWFLNVWLLNYSDLAVITFSTPTPTGVVTVFKTTSTADLEEWLFDCRVLADFFQLSYFGTFAEWKEFFANREYLPEIFSTLSFSYTAGEKAAFTSKRLKINYTNDDFEISDDSLLKLTFSFYTENGKVVWDIRKIVIDKDKNSKDYFVIYKEKKPDPELPESFQNSWQQVLDRKHPLSGEPFNEDGLTCVGGIHKQYADEQIARGRDSLYILYLGLEGKIKDEEIAARYDTISNAITFFE